MAGQLGWAGIVCGEGAVSQERGSGYVWRSVLQGKHGPLTHENLARTLLVKRPAFRHEREIRLLFTPHDFHNFKERIARYPADPNMLLDQIMLDPRMNEAKAAVLKRKIEDAGFSGSVKRSLLYAPPPDLQITWNQYTPTCN